MIVEGARLDATPYTVQYEMLRSQVTGTVGDLAQGQTAGPPHGLGLALLLSEGLPGWLQAVETVLRASLAPRAVDASTPAAHESSTGWSTVPGLSRCPGKESLASYLNLTLPGSLPLWTRRSPELTPSLIYRSDKSTGHIDNTPLFP